MNVTMRRLAMVLLLVLCVAWAGVGLSLAGASDCTAACSEQYAEDLAVCGNAYQQTLADALAERAECTAAAVMPMDYIRCYAAYSSAKAHADAQRLVCQHAAEATMLQCIYDCSQSPAAP